MHNSIIANETLPVNIEDKRKTIIRVVHNRENPFVQLNKQNLWDENLSLKATGLWARCMARPNDWSFSIDELAKHCKEGRKAIDSAMHELIEANYVLRIDYSERGSDGKYIKSGVEYVFFEYPATDEEKDYHRAVFKKSFQHSHFGDFRRGDFRNGKLLIKSIKQTDFTETHNTPPTPPQNPAQEINAAEAADVKSMGFPKEKRAKPDFSPKVREMAKQMLAMIIKHNPVYRAPADLTLFLKAVSAMVETDSQDPEILLRAFEWAVSDNEERGDFKGWQGIICTNTKGGRPTSPATVFQKHFAKIHSQMNSRPKRKFAAGSDDAKAAARLSEMEAL
jgi:hypothetical protein